jgi:hypothetical protein
MSSAGVLLSDGRMPPRGRRARAERPSVRWEPDASPAVTTRRRFFEEVHAPLDSHGERPRPEEPLPGESAPAERRLNPRRRALKRALIVYRRGYSTMGCQILDISETGALLKPADIIFCPREFVLKPDIGTPHDCEVVWRKGEVLGVRFV